MLWLAHENMQINLHKANVLVEVSPFQGYTAEPRCIFVCLFVFLKLCLERTEEKAAGEGGGENECVVVISM